MWHPGQFQEKIEPLIAVFKLLEPVLAAEADGLGVCVLGEGPRLVVQKFSRRQRILQSTRTRSAFRSRRQMIQTSIQLGIWVVSMLEDLLVNQLLIHG